MLCYSKFPLFILLALLCAAALGCSSTKYISLNAAASEEITRGSETDYAVITLKDGSSEYAYHIAVRSDSTEWYNENRAFRHTVATARIQSVIFQQSHALKGLVVGSLIGFGIGGTIGYGFSVFSDPSVFTRLIDGLAAGGIFAVAGALVGLLFGAADIEETVYVQDAIVTKPTNDTVHSRDTTQTKVPH